MPCPFAESKLRDAALPISVVRDLPELRVLLAGDDGKKGQVGNPIVPPGSELPTDEFDEDIGDEQRRDKPKEKPNL